MSTLSTSISEASTQVESIPPAASVASESQEAEADVSVGKKSAGTPDEVRELAAKTVAEDLELWKSKFNEAAEQGAIEMEERVDEISERMLEYHITMGSSLLSQLDETVQSELSQLRPAILAILKKDGEDIGKVENEVATAIRAAGLKIKTKSQDVRNWRLSYEQEIEIAVTKAVQENFEILQRTRDLALQKIGMKWAWMDGVTYKHWKQYHELRDEFEQLTEDFKSLVTSHPGLNAAQKAGTDIEDEAMALMEVAVEELATLREVASWKAIARDYSENFDSEAMRLVSEGAQQKMAEAAKNVGDGVESVAEKVQETTELVGESVSEGISYVASPDDSTARKFPVEADTDLLSEADPNTSVGTLSSSATQDVSVLSASPYNEVDTETSDPEPIEPVATAAPADGPEQVREAIIETPGGPKLTEDAEREHAGTASEATEKIKDAADRLRDEL